MAKGGAEMDLMRETLGRIVQSWGEHDKKWVQAKIESALKRAETRESSIAADVREVVLISSGYFSTSDIYRDLNLTSGDTKKAAVLALLSLEKEGIITKHGQKMGSYRRIEATQEIDFMNADPDDYLNLQWPLGLEKKTRIFQKSVIEIAGVTGMGKTTYLLALIYLNMGTHRIVLHNSEMSAQAMNYKLRQFNYPMTSWKFSMRQWKGSPDSIEPDAINIIDYLSPGANAWEIQQPISQILEKLNKGVAVIAVQKKPGAAYGTGGIYSAMDASLVLSLDWQRATVSKNRFREADEFPGLDTRNFTINHGHIKPLSGWYREPEERQKRGCDPGKKNTKAVPDDAEFVHEE
jgi:hypothetical protein